MNPIPHYPPIPYKTPPKELKDSAFSKPGVVGAKSWKPAKGVRFRPSMGKKPGRPRKRAADPRYVTFF